MTKNEENITRAKAQRAPRTENKNSKHEIRNPKQIQMTKILKFQTNSIRIRGFEFSPILDLFGRLFVSVRGAAFDIRISDFDQQVVGHLVRGII